METAILAGIFVLGGTVMGACMTYYLSKRSQREQWLRDVRKQECRELLTTLTDTHLLMIEYVGLSIALDPQTRRQIDQAVRDSYRVIRDRLFIAEDLQAREILRLWATALENYRQTHDVQVFAKRFAEINEEIVRLARVVVVDS